MWTREVPRGAARGGGPRLLAPAPATERSAGARYAARRGNVILQAADLPRTM